MLKTRKFRKFIWNIPMSFLQKSEVTQFHNTTSLYGRYVSVVIFLLQVGLRQRVKFRLA